ncbi:MAG: fibronectin type III domain-containing protein [Ignavibacteriales bacterium]|nr:fibronectin type III domain-containing protein [Ignavibacteriales bacterium]
MIKSFQLLFVILLLIFSKNLVAQIPTSKGQWKFENQNNLIEATLGNNLSVTGSINSVTGPTEDNKAIKIDVGSYLTAEHGISANGGGNKVNEYTIQIDFKIPIVNVWHTFFQLNELNNDDGDCFINPSGNIGVAATGYSQYAVKANEWYRLVISVKNGVQYKYFLDGNLMNVGTFQTVDDRFSLADKILFFGDNDAEDNEIYCAEIAIWDKAFSDYEAASLGGFGHKLNYNAPQQLILVPYLQTPQPNSIYVCWHDSLSNITQVNYGTTQALGQTTNGTSEIITAPYRWHTVKLTDLIPNTEYFYKAISGSGESKIYSFKTLPDENYKGKIRFLMFSDTHASDTTMAMKVLKESRKKIEELYGEDVQNNINFVLHCGDLVVSGNSITQYTEEYFAPMSQLSSNIPFVTVTGNHEGENQIYYNYMKYDDISAYPTIAGINERFWSFKAGGTLFIGLNTNIVPTLGGTQKSWLENQLKAAENDSTINFVFIISHHFAITELWGEGENFDAGPGYIKTQIYPILKKYSKVIQHSYGHTHGFERGTYESNNEQGDYRVICSGGGGGPTDRWGVYVNNDYPNIHITHDHYFFQLMEIDVENKTYEASLYSLGNSSKPLNTVKLDHWYKKKNQPEPAKPIANLPNSNEENIIFNTSQYEGIDSLMTARIQIAEDENFSLITLDSMANWKDIYEVDEFFNPIDRNKNIDLTKISIRTSALDQNKNYYYRVKYRDHNLKWSEWSNSIMFNPITNIVSEKELPSIFKLEQNYPNPFNPVTVIKYQIPFVQKLNAVNVSLKIYDILGREVKALVNRVQKPGNYEIVFNAENLPSGTYFYKISAGNFSDVKKMILLK